MFVLSIIHIFSRHHSAIADGATHTHMRPAKQSPSFLYIKHMEQDCFKTVQSQTYDSSKGKGISFVGQLAPSRPEL